jgi:hypothetical protein
MSEENQNQAPGAFVFISGRPYPPVEPSRPARKVVQVSMGARPYEIVTLCDDGTMWKLNVEAGGNLAWFQLPDIPQDNNKGQP